MTLKLPEPTAILDACALDRSKNCCRALHCTRRIAVNTDAQLKQAVRDALEAAAQLFPQPHAEYFGSNIQDAIRNMAKEIV